MITSLAFSLTMYTADAIKNPGIFGNTEASTTLRLRVPWTRKRLSITALGSLAGPILHVQDA